MLSSEIPNEKLEKVQARVRRDLTYYAALVARLQELGVAPTDLVYLQAEGSRAKLQDLFVSLHYAMVTRGVGRPEKPPT